MRSIESVGRLLGAILRTTVALAWFLSGLLLPTELQAQYRLMPGDSVEISAPGLPELKQRVQIDVDGNVSFPLVGELHVAGLTLADARAKLQAVLPTRELRRRTAEGREFPVIITPNEIGLSIVEYRPIYVNGDVSKPGELPFRPGMNIRQAIALAGGYDFVRFRMNNPYLELANLNSEYQSLWIEYAQAQIVLARLRAELSGATELTESSMKFPLPPKLVSEFASAESERFAVRSGDVSKEKAYLTEAIAQEEQRIGILTEQHQKEAEGVKMDAEDLARVTELFKRGSLPITRVSEARRLLLLSATRELQTTVQIAAVERQRLELNRRLARMDDVRRAELLAEVQGAVARLATLRAQLEAVGEKLTYTGLVRSQLIRGKDSLPELTVFRTTSKGRQRISNATEDLELQPGDIIEVALQTNLRPSTPAQ